MIGEDRLIHFSGVQLGEACTIVLRGASALSVPWCRKAKARFQRKVVLNKHQMGLGVLMDVVTRGHITH